MPYFLSLLLALCMGFGAAAQGGSSLLVHLVNEQGTPLSNATVEVLRSRDTALIKIGMSDTTGKVMFEALPAGTYFCHISLVNHQPYRTATFTLSSAAALHLPAITLQQANGTLQTVTVEARKPFIELQPGKTLVNMEASITGIGATALEALEKMPGVTIDRDGNISLKGRSGVLVMIDGKPTYLGPTELATLLGGMSAAQISQVEIMDQPSARYDAAGNAGIINIKTKRTKQRGFNGSINTAYSQGFYPKTANSIQLAYRTGKLSMFANYSLNGNQSFTRIYALRTYFDESGKTTALLEQPTFFKGRGTTHSLQTGLDYALTSKTTIGMALSGVALQRRSGGGNTALWMNRDGATDSIISTTSSSLSRIHNGSIGFFLRHQFSATQELTADIDLLRYRIKGDQYFLNNLIGTAAYTEASQAQIPSNINIISAKADYSQTVKGVQLEGGWKSSHITTDNEAAYQLLEGGIWKEDDGKSNHFLYEENIHALYSAAQGTKEKWTAQGGLRYEWTDYKAHQLGNRSRGDSSFSRSYNALFPTAALSFAADSSNTFSLTAGRRIDRPPFQKLNPFLFIINKYTYQQGNPFFRPQFTWNLGLNHAYKNWLVTGISYSSTRDYFSQIFLSDTSGVIIYTEGNLGRLQNWGASASVQLSPLKWWSFSAQAAINNRRMEGVLWKNYKATITQWNASLNNQFKLTQGWSAELSGFYNSRSQQDIQEILDPAGQVSLGVSKTVLKGKGTVRAAFRDVFYTQAMQGVTSFEYASEFFRLTRDTRVATLAFTYRFGKPLKGLKRREGAAGAEKERVGAGG